MPWPNETRKQLKRLKNVERRLEEQFTDRDLAVELMILASLCHEHLLVLGPPGTGKTGILSRFTEQIEASGFQYLLTRFTEPTEIFGPLDLARFQEGTFHIRTERMLPEAEVAFLDEVFQGSSAILNALLTLVNERVFHNGSVRQRVPLITLIGASNSLPDDPWLRAFADRFALRLEVAPVVEDHLESLLDRGWELEIERIREAVSGKAGEGGGARKLPELTVADLRALHARLSEVRLDAIRPVYAEVVREIRAEGIELSDRRVIKGLKLVAGAALLREADAAEPVDLWPLNHIWSRPEEIAALQGVIQPRVSEAGGRAATAARPVEEIVLDLEALEADEPRLRSDVALGAHLMSLNRLRREALNDHRANVELRQKVETAIRRALARLEGIAA